MATLEINGKRVQVDDSFRDLSPEQQAATVEEIARSMNIQPQPEGQIPNNSPIGQFNRSVAGGMDFLRTPAALMDMGVNKAYRAITGSEEGLVPEPRPTADIFRDMGVATATDAPATIPQAIGRGTGDAATMFLPVAGGLKALASRGGAIGQWADDALRGLLSVSGGAAELAAGGAAAASGQAARQAGHPELAPTAEVLGGAAALPAAVAAAKGTTVGAGKLVAKTPVTGAVLRGARDIKRAVVPMSEGGAREVARERLQGLVGGPERAAELGEMVSPRDEFGRTAAQQTGDPNLLGIEEAARAENPNLRERLIDRRQASETAITDAVGDMGGDVGDAREFLSQRVRSFKGEMASRVDRIISGADAEVAGMAPRTSEADNSTAVTQQLKDELAKWDAEEAALWAKVPDGATVSTKGTGNTARRLIEDTPRAQQNDIPRVVRQLLSDEGGFGEEETVAEMRGLYSELRRVARSAMAGNDQNKNMARISNQIADAILEDLGALDPRSSIGQAVNEARAFSRAKHETFDQGATGRILKRTLDGDEVMTSEAALDRTVGRGGNTALADDVNIRNAAPQSEAQIGDYLRSRFSERIFNASGEFTPKAARTWLRDNAETLKRYPALANDMRRALLRRDTAQAFAVRAESRAKLGEKGTIADFTKGKPEDAVDAILGADNPVKAARSIAQAAAKDSSGQALAGVKAAFTDRLTQDIGKLSAVVKDGRVSAAMSRVFTPAEMRRLRQIGEAYDRMNAPAGDVREVLNTPANQIIEVAVRIAAAKTATRLNSGGNAGVDLQTAQLASSRAGRALRNLTNQRARQLIMDAVEDPALMRELLMEPESWVRRLESGKSRLAPYLAGTAAQMGDDE